MTRRRFAACLPAVVLFCAADLIAEPAGRRIEDEMQNVYEEYRSLRPLLYSEERFSRTAEEARIERTLERLAREFHDVRRQDSALDDDPGYAASFEMLHNTLHDAHEQFKNGRKDYARWRLRNLEADCIRCHTRYKVVEPFPIEDKALTSLPPFERGMFLIAAGRYEQAEAELLQAAKQPENGFKPFEALRSLLILYVRVWQNPARGAEQLQRILDAASIPDSQLRELSHWVGSLKNWAAAGSELPPNEEVSTAVKLLQNAGITIRSGHSSELPQHEHAVDLLRASALLHLAFARADLSGRERETVTYLLALTYDHLDSFFPWEYTRFLYERCMKSFPGGRFAKECFQRYSELVTVGYSGSSGTNIPAAVQRKLDRYKAVSEGKNEPAEL